MNNLAAPEYLPIRTFGPVDGQPVVLLHGFLADSRQWLPLIRLADALTQQPVRWILPDLPGHGRAAGQFPPQPGWLPLTDLLQRSVQPHLREPALWGGYSMGGRVAAVLAAEQRLELAGLWLESAHPPLADAAARLRREEDEIRARRLESEGVRPFVHAWQELPLFASQKLLPRAIRDRQRRLRLDQDAEGLAQSLRWYGTGTMPTTLAIAVKTRILAGAWDASLLSRLPEWSRWVGHLHTTVIADAGHAVHLERPSETAAHLAATIDAISS